MRIRPLVVVLSLAAFAACFTVPALAQTVFGSILGTVTDPSGAVLPNIVVTVTNQGENISRDVRSDAQGNYQTENAGRPLHVS
jgi:hypothetical protein